MADNKLNLLNSSKAKQEILVKQQKDINKIYKHVYDNIEVELEKLKYKENISSILMTEELNKLKGKIAKEYNNSRALVKKAIEDNMETVCTEVVNDNKGFLKKVGFSIEEAYNHVPKDIVKNVSAGKIYQEDWTLTKALWGDDQKKLNEINQIVAEGIAQNKTTYEMAKDLETYVNPEAKKPWDWNKVYPNSRKKVDYVAQRLARTLVNHAYQQSVIETSKPNPFVEGIEWLSAHAHNRTCELCIQRATEDKYGLGKGIFPKDQVPLDHPNGLCTLASKIVDSLENIADRIADWAEGKEDPELDNYANALYNTDKFTQPKNPLDKFDKETATYLKDKFDGYEDNEIALNNTIQKTKKAIEDNTPSSKKLGIQYDINKLEYAEYLKANIGKAKQKQKVVIPTKPVKSKPIPKDIAKMTDDDFKAIVNQIDTGLSKQKSSAFENELLSMHDDWVRNLSMKEKRAVSRYTGSSYHSMNDILRGKDLNKYDKDEIEYNTNYINDCIKALDKSVLKETVYVRRGASITSLAGMFNERDIAKQMGSSKWMNENANSLIGRISEDKGFLSTTPITGKGFHSEIDFRIELPTGTKAAYISPISNFQSEKEMLVQKGTRFIVTGVDKTTVYLKALIDGK
jgi:hypothetical protein